MVKIMHVRPPRRTCFTVRPESMRYRSFAPAEGQTATCITGRRTAPRYAGRTRLTTAHDVSDPTESTALSRTIASTATIRLASIPRSSLLYTPLEDRFERITRLARRALGTPVAAVTLVDASKQWFKSVTGWAISELPVANSLCQWTIQAQSLTMIGDLTADTRTADHPLVTDGPKFRAYAGAPLSNDEGLTVGTFCIYDVRRREFSDADRQTLEDLRNLAQQEFLSDRLNDFYAQLTQKLGVSRRESMMDALTHLWNRRGASVLLRNAMDRADRMGNALAVMAIDLDEFKRVNDTFSHQVGDEVLRRLARRLVACTRSSDFSCRIGGDEFLLIMVDTDADAAHAVAERLRADVTGTPVRTRQGALPISVSIGGTVREPGETISADELIARADNGLMQSKRSGRNRVAMTA